MPKVTKQTAKRASTISVKRDLTPAQIRRMKYDNPAWWAKSSGRTTGILATSNVRNNIEVASNETDATLLNPYIPKKLKVAHMMRMNFSNFTPKDSADYVAGYDLKLSPEGLNINDKSTWNTPLKYGYVDGHIQHGYGTRITPKWNTSDYATAGLDMAGGALGGAATGAALGTVLGPLGTAGGAIIGGLIGLGKGIFGSSAKAKSRASLLEANRQQTIENMNNRTMTDSTYLNDSTRNPITSFYAGGGMMRRGANMGNGTMLPMSHDTQLALGPSHEQGGIQYGPNDEIEGGETTMADKQGVRVYSDRLKVPGSNITFADFSKPLMEAKGKLELSFKNNEDHITNQLDKISKPTSPILKVNSAKRRAEIGVLKGKEILTKIDAVNSQLDALFQMQEHRGQGTSATEIGFGDTQHAGGGFMNWSSFVNNPKRFNFDKASSFDGRFNGDNLGIIDNFKSANYMADNSISFDNNLWDSTTPQDNQPLPKPPGSNQMLFQAGADVLDTMSQAITSNEMARLPLPNRALLRAPRFNTHFDNSQELNAIDSNFAATSKFIKDNVRNPNIRRASMISLTNRINEAKNRSISNKTRIEQELENRNIQSVFQTAAQNNGISYQNSVNQFNKSIAGFQRTSQIAANFSDKVANIGTSLAQQQMNDMSFGLLLTQYPEPVRKFIINKMRMGSPFRQSLQGAYGNNNNNNN